MLKLFTYLPNVETTAQGPFTFLSADSVQRGGPMDPIHKTEA